MLDVNSKSNTAQEALNMIEALKDKLYNKNRFCTSDPVLAYYIQQFQQISRKFQPELFYIERE